MECASKCIIYYPRSIIVIGVNFESVNIDEIIHIKHTHTYTSVVIQIHTITSLEDEHTQTVRCRMIEPLYYEIVHVITERIESQIHNKTDATLSKVYLYNPIIFSPHTYILLFAEKGELINKQKMRAKYNKQNKNHKIETKPKL